MSSRLDTTIGYRRTCSKVCITNGTFLARCQNSRPQKSKQRRTLQQGKTSFSISLFILQEEILLSEAAEIRKETESHLPLCSEVRGTSIYCTLQDMIARCSAEATMKSGWNSFLASCWNTSAAFPPVKCPAVTVTHVTLKSSQEMAQPIFNTLSNIHLDGPSQTFC